MFAMRSAYLALLVCVLTAHAGLQALASVAPQGQSIVICTSEGLQEITLDVNGDPVTPLPHCPVCVAQMAAVLPQPGTHETLLVFLNASTQWSTTQLSEWTRTLFQAARAPPVF